MVEATDGGARAGRVETPRGSFATPCFMPVATRGSVRALSGADLEDLGAQVVLSNTYHLMLRPGADVVAALGGIHGFAAWPGHVLTDSGGFQVMSLSGQVEEEGVRFKSVYDGSLHLLTPEGAVAVQEQLGADIQMALDVCPRLPAPAEVVQEAADRTLRWAERARRAHRREGQALFGIVQGGVDEGLRAGSARRTAELGFAGYGIGGLSVGERRDQMLAALAAALAELPPDRPRYLMGVGDPLGLVEAVALGVDLFDCVAPTRLARHGRVLTATGPVSLRRAAHRADPAPPDPACPCPVCARWSRAYLRHLMAVGEPTVLRLLSLHNLAWTLGLVARARAAVAAGRLARLRAEVAAVWS
ncbi:MAG: tRNA guanosine(34) transglycosylase Tgt [Acidimicrobiales bacterium]